VVKDAPNESASNIEYYEGMYEEAKYEVPANTSVKVLARTVEKSNVNGVEDYWYYIEINNFSQSAWIFGKSIKF